MMTTKIVLPVPVVSGAAAGGRTTAVSDSIAAVTRVISTVEDRYGAEAVRADVRGHWEQSSDFYEEAMKDRPGNDPARQFSSVAALRDAANAVPVTREPPRLPSVIGPALVTGAGLALAGAATFIAGSPAPFHAAMVGALLTAFFVPILASLSEPPPDVRPELLLLFRTINVGDQIRNIHAFLNRDVTITPDELLHILKKLPRGLNEGERHGGPMNRVLAEMRKDGYVCEDWLPWHDEQPLDIEIVLLALRRTRHFDAYDGFSIERSISRRMGNITENALAILEASYKWNGYRTSDRDAFNHFFINECRKLVPNTSMDFW